jgi:hypothetical protein
VARLAEALPQRFANHRLIFDDQQFHPRCSWRANARNDPTYDSIDIVFEAQYQSRAITEL